MAAAAASAQLPPVESLLQAARQRGCRHKARLLSLSLSLSHTHTHTLFMTHEGEREREMG
jgi:hypothetical protein